MSGKRGIVAERMQWLVEYAEQHYGVINIGDQALEEAFTTRFPEAKRSQIPKCYGYCPTPMLNRTARRAWKEGLFSRRWTQGNGNLASLGFRTYSVFYGL